MKIKYKHLVFIILLIINFLPLFIGINFEQPSTYNILWTISLIISIIFIIAFLIDNWDNKII